MRKVTVAATQMGCRLGPREENIEKAESLVRQAAEKRHNIILYRNSLEPVFSRRSRV